MRSSLPFFSVTNEELGYGKTRRITLRCVNVSYLCSDNATTISKILLQDLDSKDLKHCSEVNSSNSLKRDSDDHATDEYEIPSENVLLEEVLGEGAFGVVRRGLLKKCSNVQEVAVKMLRGTKF